MTTRNEQSFGVATMGQREQTERGGIEEITKYLKSLPETVDVIPATKEQQKGQDIDLVWVRTRDGKEVNSTVEVKVDTQGHTTGNYAFETISNEELRTPGCFVRTEADLFFYYFVGDKKLHIMKTDTARDWFLGEMRKKPKRFRIFDTYTPNDNGSHHYCTIGRLVPKSELKAALGAGLVVRDLSPNQTNQAEKAEPQ